VTRSAYPADQADMEADPDRSSRAPRWI